MHEQEGPDSLAIGTLAGPAGSVSTIQTESCCEACGYILRGAGVFRHSTGLLVVRCSECSTLNPAEHLPQRRNGWWVRLISQLMGLGFVAGVLGAVLGLGSAGLLSAMLIYGPAIYHPWTVNDMDPSSIAIGLAIVVGSAFVFGLILAGLLYRVPRWMRLAVAVFPTIGLALTATTLGSALTAELLGRVNSVGYAPSGGAWALCGLLVGCLQTIVIVPTVLWGRPIVRGIVRVMLPNSARQVFECLWQRDGKLVTLGRW